MFGDNFFKKVESKTNIKKETIFNLANELQKSDMKDENTIKNIINNICDLTGKSITKEKEDKIINAIIKNKVPKNIDKMF